MTEREIDQSVLSRLVGCWQGTLLHRASADRPFQSLAATADNRWILGGRFVEITLQADTSGEAWSAVFYIGYERSERRHVLVSLEPDDRRLTTRLGDWKSEHGRLVLTSPQSRAVCDVTVPGRLRLEFTDEPSAGNGFVRFRADCRSGPASAAMKPAVSREHRRFVIA